MKAAVCAAGVIASSLFAQTIKTETHVVLVDSVVTNKKGEFVHGLSRNDFKVFEDGREQKLTSLSFEGDPAANHSKQGRYLMFLFDNSTIDLPHQQPIREAAAKFVEANANPWHLMSVAEYGPGLRITQDFTADRARLKQAAAGAKLAAIRSYATRREMLILLSLINDLAKVPGRKSLVLVSGGMSFENDIFETLVNGCNRANVAVYAGSDLAGITTPGSATEGIRTGSPLDDVAPDHQQQIRALVAATGGSLFYLKDLERGFERIGKEQNEYYMLGYTPENFEEAKCHRLKVKVNQSGLNVRFRAGYCGVKPANPLSGTQVETALESLIRSDANDSKFQGYLQAPFFYTSDGDVRINVTAEVPASVVKFEKVKGGFHGRLNILGILSRPDGAPAARFSDAVDFDFESKKALEAWLENPLVHWEKDVDGVPGNYTLKLIAGSGDAFAKMSKTLAIESHEGKQLSLSSIAFSTSTRRTSQAEGLSSEDRTALIAGGIQVIPSGRTSFKKTDTIALYAELYEPALKQGEAIPKDFAVAVRLRVRDAANGQVKLDSGLMKQTPGPTVPMALRIQVDKLEPGEYLCEISAADSLGGVSRRLANFSIE